MAVNPNLHGYLLSVIRKHSLRGDLLTYGRQNIFAPEGMIECLAQQLDMALVDVPPHTRHALELAHPLRPTQYPKPRPCPEINDQIYFRQLGFNTVTSLDGDDFEGCTRVWDMNAPGAPPDLRAAFDLTLEIGTMEHVFHVPNFMLNDFQMLRVGGLTWRIIPMNNWGNHGFYQVQPALLNDYYTANGWEIVERHVLKTTGGHWGADDNDLEVIVCDPRTYCYNFGQPAGDTYYLAAILARKLADSRGDVIPQQGLYAKQWSPPPQA
jgi:hypothetical protein